MSGMGTRLSFFRPCHVRQCLCDDRAARPLKRAAKGGTMAYHGRPARLVLTASVARRYYLDGKSKVEIADELGMSRFQVARLLEAARASGLVRIEITDEG